MYAVPTKAFTGSVLKKSQAIGNEELAIVEEFCYLGHAMTVDCRDDTDIEKLCSWQNAGQEVLIFTNRGKN